MLLIDNLRLSGKLNFRQLALLRYALNIHALVMYFRNINANMVSPNDIARKDLLDISDKLKLLVKTKQGKRYFFVVSNDLEQRIATS